MTWASPGMLIRCVDAKWRRPRRPDLISDFEKKHVGMMKDVLVEGQSYMIRETDNYWGFGDAAAVWLVDVERGIEAIRRYRMKSVWTMDRPFLLDRFEPVKLANRDRDQRAAA